MAKAEVLEVLGRRPFEARMGLQAAGASSFVFEFRTGSEKHRHTIHYSNHLYITHME